MVLKSNKFNHPSLYDRVKKLLVSYEWSDCSFSICGKSFKAHKLILGISSPVFGAMFYGPMSSSEDIIITDIEPEVFQLVLDYIYTDNVEISNVEEAFELLYASRKYLLEQLSDICISYIKTNISLDNVTSILNYPDFMHDKELIGSALKLFCEHADYLLTENKKIISPSCMKLILESEHINVKEIDLIKHVFNWTICFCEQNNIPSTVENRRNILQSHGLFKLLRFCTLSFDELEEINSSNVNLLLPAYLHNIKKAKTGLESGNDTSGDENLCSDLTTRKSLNLNWHLCQRSPLRPVAPIVIDDVNFSIDTRVKASKSVFVTSLYIPTRVSPLLNFRPDTAKLYSEQIVVFVTDEFDKSVIEFTNFMNTVEYNSFVDIELRKPCFMKKDKWYKIRFVWPQPRCVSYSYVVVYRDPFYKDPRITYEFEDLSPVPGIKGSFLSGLKYCL